ncbi:alpha-1,4-polygalactosaminidase [Rhodospirillum rubrum]|uniref:alpha-1,4-polygalactosaminidase n=1 Tax=Rhodospirillum rubrum TaxID=1085 RepID=UPI00190825B0|nr:alpha-1,4-polygalactosaminidase [Rhodospirillum rubrum]MBK1666134.1 alpha-1,4-polygalactosaminidase [Rhodospirillum rubrum]MBK1676522.1 alpha-1,4-polygalactosaminidase [Rhodospirillum rubrum]
MRLKDFLSRRAGPFAGGCLAFALGLALCAPLQAQDTHRPRVILDGRDLTEQVYDEPPIDVAPEDIPNYREMMREIISKLAEYGKARDPAFRVLVRGGTMLATQSKRERDLSILKIPPGVPLSQEALLPIGALHRRFARAIDGFVLDRRYCDPNALVTTDEIALLKREGFFFISLEPCADEAQARAAVGAGQKDGVMVATTTEPDGVFAPTAKVPPSRESSGPITSLGQARNLLVGLSTRRFETKDAWVAALDRTNYDLLLIDPFFRNIDPLTAPQVKALKTKAVGARRLVLARLTIGLADDTRYYWKPEWTVGNPPWIVGFVPGEDGVYWINYTHPDWLALVGAAFAGLMDLGYDGIVLDGVTALMRDEALMPL